MTVITGDYPAKNHQMYVFVQQLVHAIINLGVNVTVIAPQSVTHAIFHRNKLLPRFNKAVINILEYDVYRPYIISFGNCQILNKCVKWYNRRVISRLLKRVNSDVIYAHFWSSALPAYKYALNNNVPLFVACGEGDNAIENMVASLSTDTLKSISLAVKGIISVSTANKKKCVDFGLSRENNVVIIPNCVDTAVFHRMEVNNLKKELKICADDFVVAFVGGFNPRKGPDRVAKALKLLNDPKIKVLFIGESYDGYPYNFDCPGIIHIGLLEHKTIAEYLNIADVFVLPTLKEGCCNAIVEALAIGIPVISSTGDFNDDILDQNNSIRVNPTDINEIAFAIKKLKDNPSLRKQMSEYSLSRHSLYSIDDRAKRILAFIDDKVTNSIV